MAGNILYLNISLVSSKCLFKVWLFDKGGMDDKIAVIAMRRRIFRKNVPTSNAQQSCIASLDGGGKLYFLLLKLIKRKKAWFWAKCLNSFCRRL